uniref:diphosphoinositol-polyphosphate diphosphatase n=1 Tax=Capra hircus TaxID=9925 RepID=A0A8C2R7F5_CAPHI
MHLTIRLVVLCVKRLRVCFLRPAGEGEEKRPAARYPDRWIVPGGGMEPEEEPGGAAVREVFEEAGVKGKLGRLLGIFEQNQDRKHRTYVYVLTVTEILEDWEDSVSIGRKREWFKVEDAIKVLQCHKPVHAEYLQKLKLGGSPTNGNSVPLSASPSVKGIGLKDEF